MLRLAGNEAKYIQEVLHGEFRSSKVGFMVSRFEKAFADRFGVAHAIALCNGTATLHSILAAAGVGSGDSVIVPALTMASTTLAVLHAGATPVWCDVCPDSWCIDPEKIEALIDETTKAIIVVALYGVPPDMDRIKDIAGKYHLLVVEDDAQAWLATYKGRLAGTIGDASSFSLQSSKTITCGEGGIIGTSNAQLAERIRAFSCLGYRSGFTREQIQHPMAQRHYLLGWNYRLSDLQAAVALAQLEDVELHVNRRQNAAYALSQDCRWLVPQSAGYEYKSASWSYAVRLKNAPVSWEEFRNRFICFGGDPFYACWLPAYKEPMFANQFRSQDFGWEGPECEVADEIQPNIIAFKTNYDLYDEALEQDKALQNTIRNCERV